MSAFHASHFNEIEVNIPRTKLLEWVGQRLESTVTWIKHKEETLAEKLKNTTLTKAVLESMLRGGHHAYGVPQTSNKQDGGVESHEQAELIALVSRIEELKTARRSLLNIREGLKEATDVSLKVPLSAVTSLQPGEVDADPAG